MKTSRIYKTLVVAAGLALGFSSCNFLDVVPDEQVTERDTRSDRNAGINYLYSCFGYLPKVNASASMELMTGDEVITSFDHEGFAHFPKGNFSASQPRISYWNDLFLGIRQCYQFLEIIDGLPDKTTTQEEKNEYKAQAKFLIAFYHFYLLRTYGPTILVKEKPNTNTPASEYLDRQPLDECVTWIANLLDEAAAGLPDLQAQQSRYGLGTKPAAKALKAKLLLYAASPLFNGTATQAPIFAGKLKSKQGVDLMPTQYDPNKWVKARDAIKEAIDVAETAGHTLYTRDNYMLSDPNANKHPVQGVARKMRTLFVDFSTGPNMEYILVESRPEGLYDTQCKSYPRGDNNEYGYNGTSPTWAMVNRFYTKNGLPWNVDPLTKDKDPVALETITDEFASYAKKDQQTSAINLNREPRFYAWVTFQNGYYEILNGSDNLYPNGWFENNTDKKGLLPMNFLFGGRQGLTAGRTSNYSPAGYLNKKFTDPSIQMRKAAGIRREVPFPLIRLADLYLMYAEALVETNELQTAKTYLDHVRQRAGIPTVDAAWTIVGITPDQAKMRDIVRQERMIELYLEGHNFWDMRRWLLAEQYFNVKPKGMNIRANTLSEFSRVTEVQVERRFEAPTHYLMPIPVDEVNKNSNLVQNPGY